MFGDAFLAIWNDVSPAVEAEYRRWHRVEHMPERLSIPGFTLGRRYVDLASDSDRYLTIYEGRSAETFRSAAYRTRLAAPTPWTKDMVTKMHNFVRRVCRTAASEGHAIGGAIAMFRLQLTSNNFAGSSGAVELVRTISSDDAAIAVHLGIVDAEVTGMHVEARWSSTGAQPFDALLIVEGDSRVALASSLPRLSELLTKFTVDGGVVMARVYDLALLILANS